MRVVLVILESERSSFIGTAGATTDGTAAGETSGAFQVAGLPFIAGVGVSRVHACPMEFDVGAVADDAKVALLIDVSKEKKVKRRIRSYQVMSPKLRSRCRVDDALINGAGDGQC